MDGNICLKTDSNKLVHWMQYPPNTTGVFSYLEARTGATYSHTTFFGLQYILKQHLVGQVVTAGAIDNAERFVSVHFGHQEYFNKKMWVHILKQWDGHLPVRIKAVKEGTSVPVGNVLLTVENTDPECAALTNHLETILSQVWYPSTVCTLSRKVKVMIADFLDRTGGERKLLNDMLSDFGYRSASSVESAGIGGVAHLVNFNRTATIQGILTAMEYYNTDVCAFGTPSTEHSVMTAGGPDGEEEVYRRLLDTHKSDSFSVVVDSYDTFRACRDILGTSLREKIMTRDETLIVFPDSGEPISTTIAVLDILGEKFGYTVNAKGYKVLTPKVRVLWGDGLVYDTIYEILRAMESAKWAAENLIVGMGGGLLQRVHRDTQRFAFKVSAMEINGEWRDIYKNPLDKSKTSKKGRITLDRRDSDNYEYVTVREDKVEHDQLVTVFENGRLTKEYSFDEIRTRAEVPQV
jgi:nicotinamide phosphoribosyltransferase